MRGITGNRDRGFYALTVFRSISWGSAAATTMPAANKLFVEVGSLIDRSTKLCLCDPGNFRKF
jgi:hypothetical protein